MNHEWLEEATIRGLQDAMEEGSVTSRELVEMYLKRIALYDKTGPALNAVLEINPDALFLADALDHERRLSGPRGPLHGIPVLVKDNINTGDSMHTSAGSLALADSYAQEDAFVAKKLREAGAVILGKANMTEWANFMAFDMPAGYSSRGGQVLNPYGTTTFDPGGSSSGSAVAVAANLAAVSVGTETSGSIISPADSNSVVGIKPTVGLISRTGIIPISFTQDTAGPFGRTVEDAAILLGAMVGVDEKDPVTRTSEGQAPTDYTPFLDANGLKGARIGVMRGWALEYLESEGQKTQYEKALKELEGLGATLVDIDLPNIEMHLLMHEFKAALNNYLKTVAPHVPVKTLKDVIALNKKQGEACLKYEQGLLEHSETFSGTLTEPEYLETRETIQRLSRTEGIDKAMAEHNLDAWVYPSWSGSGIAAQAGYPSICVPAGFSDEGMPLGLTFSAQFYQEPTLIKLAYAYEQATHHRVKPKL